MFREGLGERVWCDRCRLVGRFANCRLGVLTRHGCAALTNHLVQLGAFDQPQILALGEHLRIFGKPTGNHDEAAFCSPPPSHQTAHAPRSPEPAGDATVCIGLSTFAVLQKDQINAAIGSALACLLNSKSFASERFTNQQLELAPADGFRGVFVACDGVESFLRRMRPNIEAMAPNTSAAGTKYCAGTANPRSIMPDMWLPKSAGLAGAGIGEVTMLLSHRYAMSASGRVIHRGINAARSIRSSKGDCLGRRAISRPCDG